MQQHQAERHQHQQPAARVAAARVGREPDHAGGRGHPQAERLLVDGRRQGRATGHAALVAQDHPPQHHEHVSGDVAAQQRAGPDRQRHQRRRAGVVEAVDDRAVAEGAGRVEGQQHQHAEHDEPGLQVPVVGRDGRPAVDERPGQEAQHQQARGQAAPAPQGAARRCRGRGGRPGALSRAVHGAARRPAPVVAGAAAEEGRVELQGRPHQARRQARGRPAGRAPAARLQPPPQGAAVDLAVVEARQREAPAAHVHPVEAAPPRGGRPGRRRRSGDGARPTGRSSRSGRGWRARSRAAARRGAARARARRGRPRRR